MSTSIHSDFGRKLHTGLQQYANESGNELALNGVPIIPGADAAPVSTHTGTRTKPHPPLERIEAWTDSGVAFENEMGVADGN